MVRPEGEKIKTNQNKIRLLKLKKNPKTVHLRFVSEIGFCKIGGEKMVHNLCKL